MDDAFKGVYRPDRVQFYRTQATNSQIGDLLRHEDELIAEVNAWREIGRTLDIIGRDATGEIVTDSPYVTDCPLCHQRITGPIDDTPRYPALPAVGHRADCPVVKVRAILYPAK